MANTLLNIGTISITPQLSRIVKLTTNLTKTWWTAGTITGGETPMIGEVILDGIQVKESENMTTRLDGRTIMIIAVITHSMKAGLTNLTITLTGHGQVITTMQVAIIHTRSKVTLTSMVITNIHVAVIDSSTRQTVAATNCTLANRIPVRTRYLQSTHTMETR